MKVLMDTSVLIAGLLSDHVQHAQARSWLAQAKAGTFEAVVSSHSLAELYSVLTRLPRTPRITPAEAWQRVGCVESSKRVVFEASRVRRASSE